MPLIQIFPGFTSHSLIQVSGANPRSPLFFFEGGMNEENIPKLAVILQAPYTLE